MRDFISCLRLQNLLRKAQQAALTLARCIDCLGIISCHEEKIGHQGRNSQIKIMASSGIKQQPDEVFSEHIDLAGSCSNQCCNGTEEESSKQQIETSCSPTEEEAFERELWVELGMELQRQEEAVLQTKEENDIGAVEDIMDEERSVCGTIESKLPNSREEIHFFPPGRIRHIVAEQVSGASCSGSVVDEPNISLYETPRHLYGKIRLSPNMIRDHYMPAYKKMIDLMIEKIKRKESS